MSVFAKVLRDLVPHGKGKLARKRLPVPDSAYGKPRPMTGFLATLTDEQREVALAGVEPELLGDPGKVGEQ